MLVRKRLWSKGKVKQGTPQKKPGGEYFRTYFETRPFPDTPLPSVDGAEQLVPVRATVDAPRLLSLAAVPLLSRVTPTGPGCCGESWCSTGNTKTALIFKVPDEIFTTATKRR